jgi:homoserine O-succinyltransferase/O-acetyltransferase
MKIAILDMYDNRPNEGMRCIQQLIRLVAHEDNADLRFDIFNVRAENHVPDLSYDIYISTGGPGVPMPLGEGWEKPFFALLDQLRTWNETQEQKKFVFLICHSFQLAMGHWQLGQVSRRKSTSFGIFPIHKTDEGESDSLFGKLPNPFFGVDSRDYQVTQPELDQMETMDVRILCMEKIRPHVNLDRAMMAVRFSPEMVGTQFHPEADGDGMLRYFQKPEKREQVVSQHGEAKYDEMVAMLQDPDTIELTESIILPTFLRQAISAYQLDNELIERIS